METGEANMAGAEAARVPQEEWDTFVLACCYAEALARAGYAALARRALCAARERVARELPIYAPWRRTLLDDYDQAITDVAYRSDGFADR